MKTSRIGIPLLLLTLIACDANEAEPGADEAASSEASGSAPAAAANDDVAELRDYDLTMERLDRLFAAQLNMARVASRMSPEERAALEQSNERNASLDDMVAAMERTPEFRDALNDAGITARDYALTTMALMQASMAMSVLQMRPNDNQDSLTREMQTNPDNVRFIQENMDEIARRQEAASAEMERLMPEEGQQ